MSYPSERDASKRLAQDLYWSLHAARRTEAAFTVENGANRCRAINGERFCEVSCHDAQGKVNYSVGFLLVGDQLTAGATSSPSEIVAAVVCWMEGHSVGDLHERFAFIGKEKRFYAAVEEGLLRFRPELADETTRSIKGLYAFSEGYELWFRTPTRSCCICQARYSDAVKGPKCEFYWNESRPLFEFPITDLNQAAQVLKRWLCDNAMPSQLRIEFPWLTIGTLADYYEAGRPLEGEFLASWDFVERHYQRMPFPFSDEVLALIADIRQAGYDRTLRAGTAHFDLVVSRSRLHGLRPDQSSIIFAFRKRGMDVHFDTKYPVKRDDRNRPGPDDTLAFPEIKFTPAVAELLRRLEGEEIS